MSAPEEGFFRRPRPGEMRVDLSILRFRPVRWGLAGIVLWGLAQTDVLPSCGSDEAESEPEVPTCVQTAQPNDGLGTMTERCPDIPPELRDDVVQHELNERGCNDWVGTDEPITFEIGPFPEDEWCEELIRTPITDPAA